MPNLNRVMLIGNLTRDPELKQTPRGTAVVSFGLAVNRSYTTEAGEKREEVTFIDCEAFARLAEIIAEYCKKGRPLFVEGRLKLDAWTDQQTQQKRSKMKVIVETMQLLGGREDGGGQQQQNNRPPQQQRPPQQGNRGGPPNQQRRPPPTGRQYAQGNAGGHDPALDTFPEDQPY